jgi:hypothetical protein
MAGPTIYDDAEDPGRAIRVGDPSQGGGDATKWGQLLTRFMRIMAAFWIVQGLMQWRVMLTADLPLFDFMPQSAAFAIIFFAVLDLVAGVGLWLATPWGGVLWLLIASAQIFVAVSMPGFFAGGYWLIGVDLVLIALYFIITFEAGRDYEAQRTMEQRRRRRKFGANARPTPYDSPIERFMQQARSLLGIGVKKRKPPEKPPQPTVAPAPQRNAIPSRAQAADARFQSRVKTLSKPSPPPQKKNP